MLNNKKLLTRSLYLSLLIILLVISPHSKAKKTQETESNKQSPQRATKQSTQDTPLKLSEDTKSQLRALIMEKRSRTRAQHKVDSRLIMAAKMKRNQEVAPGIKTMETNLVHESDGRAEVDISAEVTNNLLETIRREGGEVVNSYPQFRAVRAYLTLESLETIASLSEVRMISPASKPEVHSTGRAVTSRARSPFDKRAQHVKAQLSAALPKVVSSPVVTSTEPRALLTGSVNSEGDVTHAANQARTNFNVTGAGVKIGVISDSVDYLAQSQANGNLPSVTVLSGRSGVPDTGEGTAMLEIIHDLAPGAQLYFSTGNGGPAAFAQNILDLRAAGCNIIVDDLEYLNESPFQDAVVAQAVNTVTAAGVLYFSSAGNSGNINDLTSSVWEGDFVDGGSISADGTPLGNAHRFFAPSVIFNQTFTNNPQGEIVFLFWSDPLERSANDYDLYIVNSSGTIVRKSNNTQNGTQDPIEAVQIADGEHVLVVKYSGANRYLHVNVGRGKFAYATAGRTKGHSAAVNAFSVAAVKARTSYPNPFAGGSINPVETFSSDGPRRIFYTANGTAITPGNVSATGGTVRAKPDIAAADGVATSVPEFEAFYGTSAAAPHAAAIAGLLLSYNPSLTPAQIRTALTSTALDIEAAGSDRDSGTGIVMAQQALQAVANCRYTLSPTSLSFAASGGNGSFSVTTSAVCAWTAVSNAGWLTTSSRGSGNGTVSFTVAANTGSARTGTITVGGQVFTVSQAAGGGGGCTATPISPGQTINGSLTTSDCVFSGTTHYVDVYSFSGTTGQQVAITMNSSAFDTYLFLLDSGDQTVASDDDGGGGTNSRIPSSTGFFTLPATGTYKIYATSYPPDGATGSTGSYSISLSGGSNCTFSLSPTSQIFISSASSGSFTVSTGANCSWTAISNVSWLTTSSSGTGNGTVNYSVGANSGDARTGTINVGGQVFSVFQSAGNGSGCPSTTITPGQTISTTLTTGCMFTGTSRYVDPYNFSGTAGQQIVITMNSTAFDTYLFLDSPSAQTIARDDDGGGGTNSRIPANSGFFTLPATGTYRIFATSFSSDGRTGSTGAYTISLFSATSCSYTISPASRSFAASGGSNSFTISAPAGCNWTALSNVNWIATSSSGSGNGTINYSVAANTGAARTGTISVGGQLFTVTQSAGAQPYTITLSASPAAGGTASGAGTFPAGSSRTVTAAANNGYTFSNWTEGGNVVSTSASYTFILNGNRTLVANFTANIVKYTINVSASPTGAGTVTGGGTFNAGTSRTVTATANSGYTFSNWTENGSVVSSSSSYTFTLNSNRTLVANFTVSTIAVVVQTSPAGRSFTVDGVSYNTTQTFTWTRGSSHSIGTTATQSGGAGTRYVWSNWSDAGTISHNVIAPSSNITYTANFNTQYFLTMNAGSGGVVTPANNWYGSGQSVAIKASPNNGFTFGGWSGSGTGAYTGLNNPSTVTMNGPITETASFTAIPLRLDSVSPTAGRASGGQQIKLTGSFVNLSTVRVGGVSASWSYTNGISEITVTTPAHAVGAVSLDLVPTSGNSYSKSNAFAYLPVTFTDDTLVARVTTAKARHIIELRQAVDALRAVAGLQPAPWTDFGPVPLVTIIRVVHVQELRTYLNDVMTRLGYPTQPYTDPSLTTRYVIKRVYIEELRQRIRAIAGP